MDLTWDGLLFHAGSEAVPGDRVASWADAGYVEWADDGAAAWFAEERRAGRVRPVERSASGPRVEPTPRPRMARGPRALIFAGNLLVFFGCSVMFYAASSVGTFTDASPSRESLQVAGAWSNGGWAVVLVGIVVYIAGKVMGWRQRKR
jgi:hypothetical protein